MLTTPERRLFIVRLVRLVTIISCILFFIGIIVQLKQDVSLYRAQRADAIQDDAYDDDDDEDVTQAPVFPKRYLPTLIISRTFFLFLVGVILLGHIPLSNSLRRKLAKAAMPLQSSPWAQTDMSIQDASKRSEELDKDLQGDVSRLVGSAIFCLFCAAEELSRRISSYLLGTGFLFATVGLVNLVTAIFIYNPSYSRLFSSKAGSTSQFAPTKSFFRERPSVPSYVHALTSSASAAIQKLGSKSAESRRHPSFRPFSVQTTSLRPPPPAARASLLGGRPRMADNPAAPTLVQLGTANPLSPQLAPSQNGRHPLATDEALKLELHQPRTASAGAEFKIHPKLWPNTLINAGHEDGPHTANNGDGVPRNDKEVLIRMWTDNITAQQGQDAKPSTMVGSTVQTPSRHVDVSTRISQEPRPGGREQITTPYLSLREARARYALRKAALANQTPAPLVSKEQEDKIGPLPSSCPAPAPSSLPPLTEPKMGDVSGGRLRQLHLAPKYASMQGVVERRNTYAEPVIQEEEEEEAAGPATEVRSVDKVKHHHLSLRTSKTPSIVISVSGSSSDSHASLKRRSPRRRPPALTLYSCSRPASVVSLADHPDRAPSSPSSPATATTPGRMSSPEYPRSETTRWSQPSAANTARTGATRSAAGGGSSSTRRRVGGGGEVDRHLRERDSKYLSEVLACIRGPPAHQARVGAEGDVKEDVPVPPLPPMPPSPSPSPTPSSAEATTPTPTTAYPLHSPRMVLALARAQEAALRTARERTKMRSLWLVKTGLSA